MISAALRAMVRVLGPSCAVALIRAQNKLLRKLAAQGHSLQLLLEWDVLSHSEYFDHYKNLHGWHASRNPMWTERGCFNLLAVKNGADVLEICCGDGFNTYRYYSQRAKRLTAVDRNEAAISHARRNHCAANIQYIICNVLESIPDGVYDNVIFDDAAAFLSREEMLRLLKAIKGVVAQSGIISGCTHVESASNVGKYPPHRSFFESKEDLAALFSSNFKNVKVFETIYPSRHNLYFFASDGALPFDPDWLDQSILRSGEMVSQSG